MDATNSKQNARLSLVEEVNNRQNVKLTTVETYISQQSAKLTTFDTALAQQNAKLTASDTAIRQQSAKLTTFDTALAQQNAKLTASDTAIRQQSAKLTAVETALTQQSAKLTASEALIRQQSAKLTAVETALTQQSDKLTAAENVITQQNVKLIAAEMALSQQNTTVVAVETNLTAIETSVTQQSAKLKTVEATINTMASTMDDFAPPRQNKNDVCSNVKKACSQICFQLDGGYYVGSGWFYYDTLEDLKHGYFVTAAHCVMQVVDKSALRTLTRGFIQDPITSTWVKINASNVFYDGVADIALIKTEMDFTDHPHCCLKLAIGAQSAGDMCYVVGNPGGLDEDSISTGCIRDPHYCEPGGYQITDSIFVTCPGMGGNSGGPIVDEAGAVIGIYTFGMGESFGGGSNKDTLQHSLSTLKTPRSNRQKRYLGLDWFVPSPFLIAGYYPIDARFSSCVYVNKISPESPFANALSQGDLLLNARLPSGEMVEFGNTNNQKTPGVLIYYYEPVTIQIAYIKPNKQRIVTTIVLNKTYDDVSPLLDGPLQTGLLGRNTKLLDKMTSLESIDCLTHLNGTDA